MVSSHANALQSKHAGLEERLRDELNRPVPDAATIQAIKRQKLRIKEELSTICSACSSTCAARPAHRSGRPAPRGAIARSPRRRMATAPLAIGPRGCGSARFGATAVQFRSVSAVPQRALLV